MNFFGHKTFHFHQFLTRILQLFYFIVLQTNEIFTIATVLCIVLAIKGHTHRYVQIQIEPQGPLLWQIEYFSNTKNVIAIVKVSLIVSLSSQWFGKQKDPKYESSTISTSEQHAKHPFTSQNTQHSVIVYSLHFNVGTNNIFKALGISQHDSVNETVD